MSSIFIKAIKGHITATSFLKAAMVGALALGAVAVPHNPAIAKGAPDSFADLVEELSPAVVNISTVTTIKRNRRNIPRLPEGMPFGEWFDEFRQREGEPEEQQAQSLGSGFIIDPAGYVVTNNHVIAEADEITVTLTDKRQFEAELIGRDSRTDLAVLKITSDEAFPAVRFGDSSKVRVGDWVLTIGNPFGLGGSVTAGILSGRNRNADQGPYIDYLQTDAPINRGNSGGPMFNMDGEVVGVNTLIYSPNGGNVGIGFAIPSADARHYVGELREHGRVRRGWLGVSIRPLTEDMAESLGLEGIEGAIVEEVNEDSPAESAGIQTGDIISSWDGNDVSSADTLSRAVAKTEIGKPVKVTIYRNGDKMVIPVTTGELTEEMNREQAVREGRERRNRSAGDREQVEGLELMALNSDIRRRFSIEDDIDGVVITRVGRSDLRRNGIRPGMVVMRVNQTDINDVDEMIEAIEEARDLGRKNVLLRVYWRGNTFHAPLRLEDPENEEGEE